MSNLNIFKKLTHLEVNRPLPWSTSHFSLFWLQSSISLQHDRVRFKESCKKTWRINMEAHIWHCNYEEEEEQMRKIVIYNLRHVVILLPLGIAFLSRKSIWEEAERERERWKAQNKWIFSVSTFIVSFFLYDTRVFC